MLPSVPTPATLATPQFLRPTPLDTLRLGPQTLAFFVLDATQGEDRARADSAWVGRVFPGRHAVVVVVTDVAWPHIAGVRFWVASGAAVASRAMWRPFLGEVVARRWTAHPDKLETSRKRARLRFIAVKDSATLGGVQLYAIDGIGSEGALMAYLRGDGVLWASDYIQQVSQPAVYTAEVFAAACRADLRPHYVVAEHLERTPWATVAALVARQPVGAYPAACTDAATRESSAP